MMLQVTHTTDNRFVGQKFDYKNLTSKSFIILGNVKIPVESIKKIGDGYFMLSNSNYVIYAKEH